MVGMDPLYQNLENLECRDCEPPEFHQEWLCIPPSLDLPAEMLEEESANYSSTRVDDSLARRQFTEPTR